MNDFLVQTSWYIPLYVLIGSLLTLPWALGLIRRTGPRPAAYINLLMTFVAFLHGTALFVSVWQQTSQSLSFTWFEIADLQLTFGIEISPVSAGALELVTGISLLTQLYALGYMDKDWSMARGFLV